MTAEEILRKRFTEPFEDDFYAIVEAMKLYANAKLDQAAECATLEPNGMMLQVDKDSILNLKDQI